MLRKAVLKAEPELPESGKMEFIPKAANRPGQRGF